MPQWLFSASEKSRITFLDGYLASEVSVPRWKTGISGNCFFADLAVGISKVLSLELEHIAFLKEVEKLLSLEEDYNKDSPTSLGKSLILNRLIFNGQKINGDKIAFDKPFAKGLNTWIADNGKGKSLHDRGAGDFDFGYPYVWYQRTYHRSYGTSKTARPLHQSSWWWAETD